MIFCVNLFQIFLMQKVVIIPTYNEKDNIADIIQAVIDLNDDFQLLVIDDNSPDGTASIVKQLQSKYPQCIHLVVRNSKMGLGTAYVDGFKWAIANNYDYVFEMDADFSHNPKDLKRLFEACYQMGNHIAIGSRYVTGVNVVNWPLSRVLLSYFASWYVKIITGMKVHDATAGFICYNIEVLKDIPLDKVKFVGYAFQIEMKYRAFVKGFKIKEVPIIFTDRSKGTSKMSKSIIFEAIFGVIKLRFRKMFNKL